MCKLSKYSSLLPIVVPLLPYLEGFLDGILCPSNDENIKDKGFSHWFQEEKYRHELHIISEEDTAETLGRTTSPIVCWFVVCVCAFEWD